MVDGNPRGRAATALRITPLPLARSRAWLLVERNVMVYRHDWLVLASGFFEPLFYLLSIGIGVGQLIGTLEVGGQQVDYQVYIAPAMLAAAAMNGAIADTTYNLFFKLRHAKLYDAVLATPMRPLDVALGEIGWALIRGGSYSAAFLVTMVAMGLVQSWWALLVVPAALLVAFAFAAVGMAATTLMRSWQDFEFIQLTILPMFLFSATFYPLSVYPGALQWVVQLTPLYHGVALVRGLSTGLLGPEMLVHAAYLAVMAVIGVVISSRRIATLLLK